MSGISLRKTKEKLCNFWFHEHISALPLVAAVAVLQFSDSGDMVAVVIADPVKM